MTAFNRDGCVLMAAGGRLIQDSVVSAHSGKHVSPGGVLEAVPGTNGLFVRLLPREARQLDDAARAVVYAKATAWHARLTAEANETSLSGMPPDSPAILNGLTVEQLRERARAAGITGTSKMMRAALLEALTAPAVGAPDDDAPDSDEDLA